jgi:hypothetical protein
MKRQTPIFAVSKKSKGTVTYVKNSTANARLRELIWAAHDELTKASTAHSS